MMATRQEQSLLPIGLLAIAEENQFS